MKIIRFIAVFVIVFVSGCSTPNPGAQYANAHPELSPAHRQILTTGKVPGGLAVEGMTKEQVGLALGVPDSVEKMIEGDAWVYVSGAYVESKTGTDDNSASGSKGGGRGSKKSGGTSERKSMNKKVTVFFNGNKATITQITNEIQSNH